MTTISGGSALGAAPDAYRAELVAAVAAVRQASVATRSVQRELSDEHRATKADRSPVTVADLASQALVSLALGEAFPDDPIVGEEDADHLRRDAGAALAEKVRSHVLAVRTDAGREHVLSAIDRCRHGGGATGRYWTLDPVDGTLGFLRGEQYAIALALIEDGQVVVAALGCPNLSRGDGGTRGAIYAAARGLGTMEVPLEPSTEPGRPVRVDGVGDPRAARYCESVEASHSSQGDAARVADVLGISAEPLRLDSQCKYALVARGDASIYLRLPRDLRYRERLWDHAAGLLVVEEAGGRVTDAHGRRVDVGAGRTLDRNEGIVATNGAIHDAVLDAVATVLTA